MFLLTDGWSEYSNLLMMWLTPVWQVLVLHHSSWQLLSNYIHQAMTTKALNLWVCVGTEYVRGVCSSKNTVLLTEWSTLHICVSDILASPFRVYPAARTVASHLSETRSVSPISSIPQKGLCWVCGVLTVPGASSVRLVGFHLLRCLSCTLG